MKIDPLSSPRTAPIRRKDRAKDAGSGSFASELAAEAGDSKSLSGSGAVASVDTLLALQEVGDVPTNGEQARRHGEALLNQLDELRFALLTGTMPVSRLERLARALEARNEEIADPHLAEVVAEIELRAVVELAKLGR